MKKILGLLFLLQGTINFADLPNSNQLPSNTTLNNVTRATHKGLVSDLQNLPQTISAMMPTVSNIQKLLLSGAIIGLGYQCCRYGLSKYNSAIELRSQSNDTEKEKRKHAQSQWYALTGGSFLLAGTCLLLCAQRIANFAYGQ